MDEIRVYVVNRVDRKYLSLVHHCPMTGRRLTKSSGTTSKTEAARRAGAWEAELRNGCGAPTPRMAWSRFREEWIEANAPELSDATVSAYMTTLNEFEAAVRPQRVADLTSGRVAVFTAHLRRERTRTVMRAGEEMQETYRVSEATVARHLRHLKAVARWGHKRDYLPKLPAIEMPKRAGGRMKGRPLTGEEFDRMLLAVPKVVGDTAENSWKLLLHGLWTMGLRIGESLALRWDHQSGGVSVRMAGPRSVLVFDGESQKNGKAQIVPLVPEARQLLEPLARPTGYVFAPMKLTGDGLMARDAHKASKIVAKIGARAGIITDPEKGKTASAHDLRRSFATRWAGRVMPAKLRALMRHASIETTMAYYVEIDAEAMAEEMWEMMPQPGAAAGPSELGASFGASGPEEAESRR